MRDKHSNKIPPGLNTWDAAALAWSAEYGPSIRTWPQAQQSLDLLAWWAAQAFRRDMLVEGPISKVGVAMLTRPNGSTRVVFGFTATKQPGWEVVGQRQSRVNRVMRSCMAIGIAEPRLEDTANSRPGSCVETFTFPLVLAHEGRAREIGGTLRTIVRSFGPGGAMTLGMCDNCKRYARMLREGCPRLVIVDAGENVRR